MLFRTAGPRAVHTRPRPHYLQIGRNAPTIYFAR